MFQAVLIRALEPLEGIEIMKRRRQGRKLKDLCNGPGKLCSAMGITKEHNGMDLTGDQLYLERPRNKELSLLKDQKELI